jgi:tetratricopeptide (TPR) repeat protein
MKVVRNLFCYLILFLFGLEVRAETEQEWIRLSSELAKSGKLDEALVKVKSGLRQFPESESLQYGRATIEYTRQNYAEASKRYEDLFRRNPKNPEYMMISISLSHIAANVPAKKDFGSFLKRDLKAHFGQRVEYELLRDAPTQLGVSYPHYYAWIWKYQGDKVIEEGAVRLDAVSCKFFTVTDYIPKWQIIANPEAIERIFPKALCSLVLEKASSPGKGQLR